MKPSPANPRRGRKTYSRQERVTDHPQQISAESAAQLLVRHDECTLCGQGVSVMSSIAGYGLVLTSIIDDRGGVLAQISGATIFPVGPSGATPNGADGFARLF